MKGVIPILVSAFFTLFILCVHLFSGITTMINGGSSGLSNFALSETVDLHKNHPVFIRRKLTSWLIDLSSSIFNIEIGSSFVLVNFFFLFLSGILIFKLSNYFSNNFNNNIINLVGYFLCFPVFFMFFPPVYSYDEPLQFCLTIISLIYFFKENYWKFSFVFAISLIARESSIIILPALFFIYVYNWKNTLLQNLTKKEFLIKSLSLGLPICVYAIYLFLFIKSSESIDDSKEYFLQRFSYIKWNFQSYEFTIESIAAFLLVFAVPLYFLIINRNNRYTKNSKTQKLIQAFLITLIINTAIVYLNTRAREVRLFLIPMFFLWPIFGSLFFNEIRLIFKFDKYKKLFLNLKNSLVFLLITFLNLYVSFVIYQPTAGPKIGVFNLYLFLSFTFILTHYMLSNQKKI